MACYGNTSSLCKRRQFSRRNFRLQVNKMKITNKIFLLLRDLPNDSHNLNLSDNGLQFNTLDRENYRIKRLIEADKAEIVESVDDERLLVTIDLTAI